MKKVILQITMEAPNDYPLNTSDDIWQFLIDSFDSCGGGGGVYIDGKVL